MMKEMFSNDIAKRFELLENQWLDFQQRSSTPDLEEEPIEFPSSLASFDNASQAPSDTQSSRRANIILPRPLKPLTKSTLKTSAFEDQNKTTTLPDSPLSSSSTLSSSSSSSTSSPAALGHNDALSSRRKRLFSEPATPIKETIIDSTSPGRKAAPKSPQTFSSQKQKKGVGLLSSDKYQSRSPPPGAVLEEVDGTCKPSPKPKPTARSLWKKGTVQPASTTKPATTMDNDNSEALGGRMVMRSLHNSLVQVLSQLESKEKCLGDAWKEWNVTSESSRGLKHCAELEALASGKQMGFSGLPRLAGETSPEKWCDIVSTICQRLVSYLQKETLLQKWAISLEKEAMRVLKLEEDIVEAKVHTAEELEVARKMKTQAEEKNRIAAEERDSLVKDRDALVQWVSHLQERQKALTDRERDITLSVEEVESSVHQIQEDRQVLNNLKVQLQERERTLKAKEREVELQLTALKKMQDELHSEQEKFRRDKISEEKEKAKTAFFNKELEDSLQKKETELSELESVIQKKENNLGELEDKLLKKERSLGEMEDKILKKEKTFEDLRHDLQKKERELEEVEIDLAEKVLATENLSKKLVAREKVMNELQSKSEQERRQIQDAAQNLEKEKKKLHVAEVENELSKKNAQEILAQVTEERKKSSAAVKKTEERLRTWEDNLKDKEKDLQQQESILKELEAQLIKEQERSHTMHAKLLKDQETIMAEEEDLKQKEVLMEAKSNETRKELEKLNRERKQILTECKRLTEMEARIHEAERALELKQHDHQQKVNKQAEQYQLQIEELEAVRQDLDSRTAELQRMFEQFQTEKEKFERCKKEEEEELELLMKQKDGLKTQHQKLKALQREIEKAGADMINHIMVMDQASAKLESQRHQLESLHQQLEALAENLMGKQKLAKDKEEELNLREERLEEQGESLLAKRREMSKLEVALKKKEEILEEQSCTLLKLEVEVKDRMRRVDNLERKSCELEKGWEELRQEQAALLKQRDYLGSVRTQFEQLAASQKAELQDQARERDDLNRMKERLEKQRIETSNLMEVLRDKELKASEKESSLFDIECKFLKRRSQIENDAEELRQQLKKAHAELDAQRRYVEDRQKAVDLAVMSLKEEATKLNTRKREIEEKEQYLQTLEERQRPVFEAQPMASLKKQIFSADEKFGGMALAECQLEDGQTETAILIRERENLKAQQLELEKTKLAVQEAKSTLAVQLKASKQMVADASLIAQKASREREALEEERRLLSEKKKELEVSLSARELELATEANRIENMKKAFEEGLKKYEASSYASFDDSKQETRDDANIETAHYLIGGQEASHQARLPSQKRLENVMSSLLDARQASRSRLQRTENAISALPASAPSTMEVKQALQELSTRLSNMEQVEEDLACQLREAYEAESTEECAIVDKVELLCKMEEQQNIRAEWEQDMQQQLEKISILQTASSGYDTMVSMDSVDRALSPIMQHSFSTELDWNMSFGSPYKDRDAFSAAPLVDYSNEQQQQQEQHQNQHSHLSDLSTRRKLLGQYGSPYG